MPRVQEKAPGILPSRSISRGSRISTITMPSSEASLIASAALTVSISALASSISALMPRWMVWGMLSLVLFLSVIPGRVEAANAKSRFVCLPHQFLHRAFEALDRDRIHALREDAA